MEEATARAASGEAVPGRDDLELIYRANIRRVYAFASARLGRSDGEEVAAEVFQAAAVAFADGRAAQVTTPWLMAVTRNKVIDRWRKAERHMAKAHLVVVDDEPTDPALAVVDAEERELVLDALSALKHRHRRLLVMRYIDAMSVPAIAEATGQSRRAVESALARARKAFSAAYDKERRR